MKSIYENNFVLQGCLFARNFCKASRMFLSKSYQLHNTYEIRFYAFTMPTRETLRPAKIKEKQELHRHQHTIVLQHSREGTVVIDPGGANCNRTDQLYEIK
jgi:hypothetical protein